MAVHLHYKSIVILGKKEKRRINSDKIKLAAYGGEQTQINPPDPVALANTASELEKK